MGVKVVNSGDSKKTVFGTVGYISKTNMDSKTITVQIGSEFVGFVKLEELDKLVRGKAKKCKIELQEEEYGKHT